MTTLKNLKNKITVILFDSQSGERLMTISGVDVIRALEEVSKAGYKGYISTLYFELPFNLHCPTNIDTQKEEREQFNLNLFI